MIYYRIGYYTLFPLGFITGYLMSHSGINKKIVQVQTDLQQVYQVKLEEKQKETDYYKKSIENLQQNNIVTTTEITKKDGEKVKTTVVNHTKFKVISHYEDENLSFSHTISHTDMSLNSKIKTLKEEDTQVLKHYSLSFYMQTLPTQNMLNLSIESGVRLFNLPLWASTLVSTKNKNISLGMRIEL